MNTLRTPEEILTDVQGKRFQLLCETENKIVAELEKNFVGEPVEIWLYNSDRTYLPIMDTLKEKFAQFNWKIEIVQTMSNQREGEATKFRLSRLK